MSQNSPMFNEHFERDSFIVLILHVLMCLLHIALRKLEHIVPWPGNQQLMEYLLYSTKQMDSWSQ